MRLSKKQNQEIEFLSTKIDCFSPTDEEIRDFIDTTVYGRKRLGGSIFAATTNRLLLAKRLLDLTIKMWSRDWGVLLFKEELLNDPSLTHPYLTKIVIQIDKTKSKMSKGDE